MTNLLRNVAESFPLFEDELKSSFSSSFEPDAFRAICTTLTHGKWK